MKKAGIIAMLMLLAYGKIAAQSFTLTNASTTCTVTVTVIAHDGTHLACGYYHSSQYTLLPGTSSIPTNFTISAPSDLNPSGTDCTTYGLCWLPSGTTIMSSPVWDGAVLSIGGSCPGSVGSCAGASSPYSGSPCCTVDCYFAVDAFGNANLKCQ